MYNIELTINNKEVFVSGRIIAERFGKRTDNVNKKIRETMEIDDIDNALKNEGVELDDMRLVFATYIDSKGEERVDYLCNEALFNELVGSFTGKEARKYRVEFREQFRLMREQLQRIANGEGDFVETLSLTRYSVEKYLPQFLNWKNVDTVLPKLVERCMTEIDKGTIKLEVLSSAIRIARGVRDKLEDVAEREIMNRYIEQASDKREKIMATRLGGVVTSNNKLEDKCKRLQEGAYTDEDFFDFIDNVMHSKAYAIYSESMKRYVGYIASQTNMSFNKIYRTIYMNVSSRYNNIYVPKASVVKAQGFSSLSDFFNFKYGIELLNEFASEGEAWANRLGYSDME